MNPQDHFLMFTQTISAGSKYEFAEDAYTNGYIEYLCEALVGSSP